MFIFRRNKIVIDAFTWNEQSESSYPIVKANRNYPNWVYKDLPAFLRRKTNSWGITKQVPTMKKCPGISELFRNSFLIPSPIEILLAAKDGELQWEVPTEIGTVGLISTFGNEQKGKWLHDKINAKINLPWIIKEKTGVRMMVYESYYNQRNYNDIFFKVIPGILDFKSQNELNINLTMPLDMTQKQIKAGEFIATLQPLSEADVDVKMHTVTWDEYNKISSRKSYQSSFIDNNKKVNKGLTS